MYTCMYVQCMYVQCMRACMYVWLFVCLFVCEFLGQVFPGYSLKNTGQFCKPSGEDYINSAKSAQSIS